MWLTSAAESHQMKNLLLIVSLRNHKKRSWTCLPLLLLFIATESNQELCHCYAGIPWLWGSSSLFKGGSKLGNARRTIHHSSFICHGSHRSFSRGFVYQNRQRDKKTCFQVLICAHGDCVPGSCDTHALWPISILLTFFPISGTLSFFSSSSRRQE